MLRHATWSLAAIALSALPALGAGTQIYQGPLRAPGRVLGEAVRAPADLERVAEEAPLPEPVLARLRQLDLQRTLLVVVSGPQGTRIVSTELEPARRSVRVVVSRPEGEGPAEAVHVVALRREQGARRGVVESLGLPDSWAGAPALTWQDWQVELAYAGRWERAVLPGRLIRKRDPELRLADGRVYLLGDDLRGVNDHVILLPPDPVRAGWQGREFSEGVEVEVEGQVDHAMRLFGAVRRISLRGTPYALVRASTSGRVAYAERPDLGQHVRTVLRQPDGSEVALVNELVLFPDRGYPEGTLVTVRGFRLLHDDTPQGRFFTFDARLGEERATPVPRGPPDRPLAD